MAALPFTDALHAAFRTVAWEFDGASAYTPEHTYARAAVSRATSSCAAQQRRAVCHRGNTLRIFLATSLSLLIPLPQRAPGAAPRHMQQHARAAMHLGMPRCRISWRDHHHLSTLKTCGSHASLHSLL